MGLIAANYRRWLCGCPQAPQWGNRILPEAAGVPGPEGGAPGEGTREWCSGRCPGSRWPRSPAAQHVGTCFGSVVPNGPKPRPTPTSVDDIFVGFCEPGAQHQGVPACLWLPLRSWGAQSDLREPRQVPRARSSPVSRTKPASAAQKQPGRAVQGLGRRGGPCPRRLRPSPARPRATGASQSPRIAAGPLALPAQDRSGEGARRGMPCPRPGRGAAGNWRTPPKFTSCVCTPSGQTRGVPDTQPSPISGWGRVISLPPQRCFLRKEKIPSRPRTGHQLSPGKGLPSWACPFLKFSAGKARSAPSPSAARTVTAGWPVKS